MNNSLFFIIVSIFLLFNIIWAFFKAKSTNTLNYVSDSNKYGWLTIALTVTGTIVGGGMFLAVGQIGYEAGVTGFAIGAIYLLGLSIVAIISKYSKDKLNATKSHTLLELIQNAYGNKVVKQFSFINMLLYIFLLASQFIALIQFAEHLQSVSGIFWIPWALVGLAVISMFLYPIIGGLRKDIQTDIFQMILVGIGSFLLIWKLFSLGNPTEIWNSLPVSHKIGTAYGELFVIGAIIFSTPLFLVRMDIWQRIGSAKSDRSSKIGFMIAGLLACLFYFLFTAIGMWGYSLKTGESKFASLDVIFTQINDPIILAFIVGAFFAAVLSSADTFINNSSIFASRIIYSSLWKDSFNKKVLLLKLRVLGLLMVVLSLILSYFIPDLVDLLVGAFSLLLIYLPTILGIFQDKWQNEKASFWSSWLGVLIFLILFFSWNPKLAFIPSVIISIISFIIIHIFTKKSLSKKV